MYRVLGRRTLYALLALFSLIILVQGYVIYQLQQEHTTNETAPIEKSSLPLDDLFKDFSYKREIDPFDELRKMQAHMREVVKDMNSGFDPTDFTSSVIEDRGTYYILQIHLPGADKKNISIDVRKRLLHVKADLQSHSQVHQNGYINTARQSHRFYRSFQLPDDADEMNIRHSYDEDTLQIQIDKMDKQAMH